MRSLISALSEAVGDVDLGSQIRQGISAGTYALSPEIKEYKVLDNGQVAVSTTVVVTLPPTKEIVAVLPQNLIPQVVQAQPMLAMVVDPKFLTADMVTALWYQSEKEMRGFFQKVAKGGLSQYSTEVLIALLNTRTGTVFFGLDPFHPELKGIVKELQGIAAKEMSVLVSGRATASTDLDEVTCAAAINTDEVMIEVRSVIEFYDGGKPLIIKRPISNVSLVLQKSEYTKKEVSTLFDSPVASDEGWYIGNADVTAGMKGVVSLRALDDEPPIKTIQMRSMTRGMLELLVRAAAE